MEMSVFHNKSEEQNSKLLISFVTEHRIPRNGQIVVMIPNEISVSY